MKKKPYLEENNKESMTVKGDARIFYEDTLTGDPPFPSNLCSNIAIATRLPGNDARHQSLKQEARQTWISCSVGNRTELMVTLRKWVGEGGCFTFINPTMPFCCSKEQTSLIYKYGREEIKFMFFSPVLFLKSYISELFFKSVKTELKLWILRLIHRVIILV